MATMSKISFLFYLLKTSSLWSPSSEHERRLIPSSLTFWVFCLEQKFKIAHSTLIQQAVPGFHNLGYPSQANSVYYVEERQKLSVQVYTDIPHYLYWID